MRTSAPRGVPMKRYRQVAGCLLPWAEGVKSLVEVEAHPPRGKSWGRIVFYIKKEVKT